MKQKTATKKVPAKAARKTASSTAEGKRSSNGSAKTNSRSVSPGENEEEQQHDTLLEKLFCDLLKDMLWAEKQLVKALAQMQASATTEELQDAFEDHAFITQKQVSRLEKVFKYLGKEPEEKKCDAMAGLIAESESLVKATKEGSMTRDAALIIAAQKVEHYEIATYGSLVQLAITMGYDEIADLLEKTLWEEENTDYLLTDIAESCVNPLSDQESGDTEESSRRDRKKENGKADKKQSMRLVTVS